MKKKRIVAFDTNVVLRWLLGDIPIQGALAEGVLKDSNTVVHVPDLVFFEIEWVLTKHYMLKRDLAAGLIAKIFECSSIRSNSALFKPSLAVYVSKPQLSLADICLAEYSRLSGAEYMLTFDRKMANQIKNVKLMEA